MRLGGPIFEPSQDPEELVKQHQQLGYRAAFCPEVDLQDKEYIKAIRDTFEKNDLMIAEVGAWSNLLDVDEEKRKGAIEWNKDRLALAEEIGARCCVNIAGSKNTELWDGWDPQNFTPETFEEIVDTTREIIDTVQPKKAKFTLEMMPWAYPDSADSYLKLIEAIDRPGFGVHLDPVNIINSIYKYHNNVGLLKECFAKLGPYIVSCHAKDTILNPGLTLHISETRIGIGTLDYDVFLREMNKLPGDIPLMMEHLETAREYDLAKQHLLSRASVLGLTF